MQKFLSVLFLLCLTVGLNVLVLMKGWGIHPQSWWWIIGGGVVGQGIIQGFIQTIFKPEPVVSKEETPSDKLIRS